MLFSKHCAVQIYVIMYNLVKNGDGEAEQTNNKKRPSKITLKTQTDNKKEVAFPSPKMKNTRTRTHVFLNSKILKRLSSSISRKLK